MSSFIGHALIGVAMGTAARHSDSRLNIFVILFFITLSISPDFDYVAEWLFNIKNTPRYTHSIGYCLVVSLFALAVKRWLFIKTLKNASLALLLLTPLSHLVLDFFVGVYKNPILWPLDNSLMTFKYGLLPSAGKISFSNYYFWRNLVIEVSILIPIVLLVVSSTRTAILSSVTTSLMIATVLFIGLYFGFTLQR